MRPVLFFGGSSQHKARAVVRAFPDVWSGSVLDVGCRGRELEAALEGRGITYTGVDITSGAEVVADLGRGLPLPDDCADVVVALDVLEHTDDIYKAFGELCRVARSHILIALPNQYELGIRLRILRGRAVSGKYGLPTTPPPDRHRWFFSLSEGREFIQQGAGAHGWLVTDEGVLVGHRRRHAARVIAQWPNLLAPTYLAILRPARSAV